MQSDIKQWGTFQDGTNWDKYFSFPIAFPTACYASCVADIYDGDKNEDVYFRAKPTTTQFRLKVGAGFNCPHLVIAIGKQQWGLYQQPGVVNHTVSFPIAFPSACWCCVNTCGYTSTTGAQAYGVYSRSKTQFVSTGYGCGASNTTYVAIGNQQWGRSVNANTTFTYPLALSLVLGVAGMSIEGDWSFVTDITTTKLYNNTDCKASLLVVGKAQQWGVSKLVRDVCPFDNENWDKISFNISFTTTSYVITMLPCTSDYETRLNLIQAASNKYPSSSQLYKETDKMWTWWGGDGSVAQWIVVGFQLQWGKVDNLTKDKVINFFISYTANPVVFVNTLANSNDNSGDAYANWVYGITSASFVYDFYNTAIGTKKGLWVSIGQQQWGKGNTTTSRDNIVTLPVSYITSYACMVAQYHTSSAEKYSPQVLTTSSKTTLYLHWGRTYNSGSYVKWFTIGYQQWSVTAITHPIKWTFSISFSSNPYFIGSIKQGKNNNWTPSYPVSIGSFTKTYVNVRPLETVSADDKLLYNFAIGY